MPVLRTKTTWAEYFPEIYPEPSGSRAERSSRAAARLGRSPGRRKQLRGLLCVVSVSAFTCVGSLASDVIHHRQREEVALPPPRSTQGSCSWITVTGNFCLFAHSIALAWLENGP